MVRVKKYTRDELREFRQTLRDAPPLGECEGDIVMGVSYKTLLRLIQTAERGVDPPSTKMVVKGFLVLVASAVLVVGFWWALLLAYRWVAG